jgi:spore maturation protein CgeB
MQELIQAVIGDENLAASLAGHGRRTILQRHTCAHRVDELLEIHRSLGGEIRDAAVEPEPGASIEETAAAAV